MYEQGSMFRARYLHPDANLTEAAVNVTDNARIQGIEWNAIDNSQLYIATNTDEWTAESALAFMQGLYPPSEQTYSDNAGGTTGASLADNTLLEFPLDGYQYPKVRTMSILDPESIWIQGHVQCWTYMNSVYNIKNNSVVNSLYEDTLDFYHGLWQKIFTAFDLNKANFNNAYELYEYAQYLWTHDESIREHMTATDLAYLRDLAATQQKDYANLTVSGNNIGAIAGRTLAAKVVSQLQESFNNAGSVDKLSVVFGSYEPFMSYFALADLVSVPGAGVFNDLPNPGAAMLWELFSVGSDTTVYPSEEEMWVRFLYRNGTDSEAAFTEYPIFGNPYSESSMRFTDFKAKMAGISVGSVSGWCQTCDSVNIFCEGLAANTDGSSSAYGAAGSSPVTPAVGGVIGAAVTVAVLGLALLAAMILGGVRIVRHDPVRRNSSLGGFKGAEKMASDTDLAVAKGGARHERVGSWELRDGSKGADGDSGAGAVVTTKAFGLTMPKRDDDAISEMNVPPVHPREEV
ncbi:putative histidine acid protein [Phaeoacremonium minimum UCRPA7]|uniref:Putative histidine acid protein n=1 Tax=Phaeoacremonium minimum (strain UCR-PA7) TaxID=1286976 RepID=R8BW72_PHAM7|nr:putative histidine acid protein [Phaeoacremonium minimum UCRPA7]EOO03587.1 putative histidine acid protein [Phaeoacremonium minimum UCRPA7]